MAEVARVRFAQYFPQSFEQRIHSTIELENVQLPEKTRLNRMYRMYVDATGYLKM